LRQNCPARDHARSRVVSLQTMTRKNSSLSKRSDNGKESTVVKDTAETIYAGTDHVARCPECGRETLWADREHLTHTRACAYYEVNRQ